MKRAMLPSNVSSTMAVLLEDSRGSEETGLKGRLFQRGLLLSEVRNWMTGVIRPLFWQCL